MKLEIIGAGQLGGAIIGGLIRSGWAKPEELLVVEIDPARRDELAKIHPGLVVSATVVRATDALLAFRPQDTEEACTSLGNVGCDRALSVIAGWSTDRLQALLGEKCRVIRSIPNVPSLVGAGVAGIAPGKSATAQDLEWAAGVLGAVGETVQIAENLMDAATGLAGSGPAYIFLVAEALIEAGVLVGFTRDVSAKLTNSTLLGAARMLTESGKSPEVLRASVTSPGGTTAAGLLQLEKAAMRAAFGECVLAATRRSEELGRLKRVTAP